MNTAELAALSLPLSNESRVLYLLGLRPSADCKTGLTAKLNNKQLLALMNGSGNDFTLGRQVNKCVRELVDAGLIAVPEDVSLQHSINGKQLTLPLLPEHSRDFDQLHLSYTAMHSQWRPEQSLYLELAQLLGIIDSDYSDQDVGEFVAYWLGQPQRQFSLYQWTQKFAFKMKKNRLAQGYQPQQQVGQQQVKKAAGLEADDKAKQLVEKYRAKS